MNDACDDSAYLSVQKYLEMLLLMSAATSVGCGTLADAKKRPYKGLLWNWPE